MFEVDNAGNPNCAFLAFAKGLIWLIQAELKHGDNNKPLLTTFCELPDVHEQEGFVVNNPDLSIKEFNLQFLKELNLQKDSYFLKRAQSGLRKVLVNCYFTALQTDLAEIQQVRNEELQAVISRNDNITELLMAVYEVLNRRNPSQNDFFSDAKCQEKIRRFVFSLESGDMDRGMIAPSRLKEFIISMFLCDSNQAASRSSIFTRQSIGACVIEKKAKGIWGTFNDLTILANHFNINLVVVNIPESVASSLQDARPKIYLNHTSTARHQADHWTTILNAFPYSPCALLPESVRQFEKRAYSFDVSKVEIKKLFNNYIQDNFKWFCYWNSRDHLKLASEILTQCAEPSYTAEDILTYLITHPPGSYNPRGEFAAIMNYLCYRQFGIKYADKCRKPAEYEQLIEEVRLNKQDIACYRPLEPVYDEPVPMYDFDYTL